MALAAGSALAQAPGGAPPGALPGAGAPGGAPGGPPGGTQAPSEAPSGVYKVDPHHSYVEWSISHMGNSNYTQRFTKYDVTITLDRKNLENSKVNVTIDPTSTRTGYDPAEYKKTHAQTGFDSWDDQLAYDAGYFNAKKFPTITFNSTKVQRTGDKMAKVTGDLTFLGVTKPVTLDVDLIGEGARGMMSRGGIIGFHAKGKFNRKDFGMGGFMPADVGIEFDGEFNQQVSN
jgi:polyisoprenoid-binding protein YceI